MALSELWALELLLAAFAGGAFGAAVGALPSFSLAGFVVVAGELFELLGRSTGGAFAAVDVTGSIGLGVVLGPHVAFGGGAAALAYATRRGYVDPGEGFEFSPAKEVTRGLGSRPDVLAVGGVFGIVGFWVATLSSSLALPTDPVALGVVVSALLHRVVFGYSLVGAAPGRLFDMSPYERAAPDAETLARGDGGTHDDPADAVVEPWLPYQYRWSHVATLGAVVGVLGAFVAYRTGSAFLAFGISVAALTFVNAGAAEIPVTHHMALPASTVVLASVDAPLGTLTPDAVASALPLGEALVLGAAFGLLGGLVGEVAQRVFYAHARTHLDPPAASIVVTSLCIAALALAGVLPGAAWVPLP